MAQAPPQPSPSPKRQCWECARRRLVCDYTQPGCKKCAKAGVDCPGYDEKKPLKWLTPGKVSSKRSSKTAQKKKALTKEHSTGSTTSLTSAGSATSGDGEYEGIKLDKPIALARLRSRTLGFGYGSPSGYGDDDDDVEEIPRFLSDETTDVVQSIHYYNTRVYPEYQTIMQMVPNPYVVFFPLKVLHYLPPAMNHTMACFGYGHRIYQRQLGDDPGATKKAWTRIYHHRGLAIRELGQVIAKDDTRCTDVTIATVVLLLVTEVLMQQKPTFQNWRDHADGLMRLLQLRGGYYKVFQSSPHLKSSLIVFLIIAIYGNATSPSATQFEVTSPFLLITQVSETYNDIFPHVLCPKSLFIDLITINNIRSQTLDPAFVDDTTRYAAEELLSRIKGFSPQEWAIENGKGKYEEEWITCGSVFQSAIMLYCILSLQSLCVFPSTIELESLRSAQGDILYASLEKALASVYLQKFMMWPLVVSGVEAVNRSVWVQSTVANQLEKLSFDIGTSTPLTAKVTLEAFWASGRSTWDDCFNRPYAFVV